MRDDERRGQRYMGVRNPHPLAVVAIAGMWIEHRMVSTPTVTAVSSDRHPTLNHR